ncbi:MAG: ferrous iron transport protein B, partial [Spirochaetota bacterium]
STTHDGIRYDIIDLPGAYSLTAHSEDERATRDFILSGSADVIVNIVDASNLEQSLFLTSQLIEMKVPLIIAVNRMDVAIKKNISIDLDLLEEKVGCTVLPLSAVNTREVSVFREKLFSSLDKTTVPTAKIRYPNEVELYFRKWDAPLSEIASRYNTTTKWCTVKLLEQDPWITGEVINSGSLESEDIDQAVRSIEGIHQEEIDIVIADYRYGFVHGLVLDVVTRIVNRQEMTDRIDRFVLSKLFGIPFFLAIMYATFFVSINIGTVFIDFFDILFGGIFVDGTAHLLTMIHAPDVVVTVLADGIGTGLQTVATFVPIIFFMFFMLAILEDSGYMARASFVMDRFMRILGLPGKAFVPMIVGFGCTVPAIMGTRILENRRDKLLTIFLTPFMSCGARLPVYALFSAAFFPHISGLIVFSLYITGITIAMVSGFMLKMTLFQGETSHFIMELPTYNLPRIRHIVLHTWLNMREFINRAGVLIIAAVTVLSLLNTFGFDGSIGNEQNGTSILAKTGKAIAPVMEPMGISRENWPATVALITGIFAKEAIIGTLNSMYRQSADDTPESSTYSIQAVISDAFSTLYEHVRSLGSDLGDPLGLSGTQADLSELKRESGSSALILLRDRFAYQKQRAYAYLLFVLIYFPCIGALGAIFKEAGTVIGWMVISYSTVLAWIAATLFYQLTLGGSSFFIVLALLMLCILYGAFYFMSRLDYFRKHIGYHSE